MIKSIKWLFRLFYKYANKFVILDFMISMIYGFLSPISVIVLQKIIQLISKNTSSYIYILIYLVIILLREIIPIITSYLSAKIQYCLGDKMQNDIIKKINKIEYYEFEKKESRDILKHISNKPVELLYDLYKNILSIIVDILAVIGYLFVINQIYWLLTICYLCFIILNFKLSFKAIKLMSILYDQQTKEERQLDYLSDLLMKRNVLTELRVFQSTSYIINFWKSIADKVMNQRLKVTIRAQFSYVYASVISLMWMAVLLLIVIYRLTTNQIDLATCIVIINSSSSLIALTIALSNYGVTISKKISNVNQYIAFLNIEEMDCQSANTYVSYESGIVFDHVTFTYPGTNKKVLDNLSFNIKHGDIVALVGENGAGKSTITKLLCKLYKPTSGKIYIDGHDINDISHEELASLIGISYQDFEKFSLTLRENVALGKINDRNDDESILMILKKVFSSKDDFNLDQYLGIINEDGKELSGGQWQRISLARAFFGNKRYIILDEPTAAIDPIAESNMYHLFSDLLVNKTGLIISHRLASAVHASKILVLQNGSIIEEGDHHQLIHKKGSYSYMWEKQSSWFDEKINDEKK